jgi:hypothetical protein
MTLVYVNSQSVMKLVQQQIGKTNPAAGDYLAKKLDSLGGAALATRFENGEIVDRFSLLLPRPAQLNFGMDSAPCPFETLKFTGPDTRFYWASSINWKQCYQNLKEQPPSSSFEHTTFYPVSDDLLAFLQNWVRGAGLDVQQNIVDALGSEISVQAEWSQDATWPEVGLFVKLDKPDDRVGAQALCDLRRDPGAQFQRPDLRRPAICPIVAHHPNDYREWPLPRDLPDGKSGGALVSAQRSAWADPPA